MPWMDWRDFVKRTKLMNQTRTGKFPIGFRRGGSEWQCDLQGVLSFAKANQFAGLDVGAVDPSDLRAIIAAGLRIGTVDLKNYTAMVSADARKRKAAAQENAAYIRSCVSAGAKTFFVLIIPEEPAKPRPDNFRLAVDGWGQLAAAIGPLGARLAIEGWPGPRNSALACTPADYRAFLKEMPPQVGVNFDPSHLIRMGIDPVRSLPEFAPRVYHVHGKDTELLDDELQEHGHLQNATFAKAHGCGEWCWRYAIPGHGCVRWGKLFSILQGAGYQGMVSVELEDENFNGSTAGEQEGLIAAREFLSHV